MPRHAMSHFGWVACIATVVLAESVKPTSRGVPPPAEPSSASFVPDLRTGTSIT
jgi:hypothetical protein